MSYIDPTEVAPDNYRVVWEDGSRRVVEMRLKAGEIDNQHSHPDMVGYFVRGSRLRIHLTDGSFEDKDFPDGSVLHHGPWTHTVENIGTTDVFGIIFETK